MPFSMVDLSLAPLCLLYAILFEILKLCVDETGKPNAPLVLYYRGNLDVLDKPGIAVIGTREPSPNGEKAGLHFAAEFAKRGYNIVSGIAIGCDTTDHKGATTAFLANGLDWDSIYPKENLKLAKEMVYNGGGLLLSEYAIDIFIFIIFASFVSRNILRRHS